MFPVLLPYVFLAARPRRLRRASPIGFVMAVCFIGTAQAGTLVYTPTNPTFGGNPLNGAQLFANAQAQFVAPPLASAGSTAQTPGQIFAQQLTSQLYSSLANQITQAIFGANAAKSGTFSFEGTTITFNQVGGNIDISINDGSTITNVTVPAGP
jgi:curli production assembly/transport component CsgF